MSLMFLHTYTILQGGEGDFVMASRNVFKCMCVEKIVGEGNFVRSGVWLLAYNSTSRNGTRS